MNLVTIAASASLLLASAGCQTSEKERRSETLRPAAANESEAAAQPRATGPTLYGQPTSAESPVRCPDGDAGTHPRSDPTVDVGVRADVVDQQIKNPSVYSETNCVP